MAAWIRAHELTAGRGPPGSSLLAAGADADPVQLAAAEAELRAVDAALPAAREAFRLAEEAAAAARARAEELGAGEATLRRVVVYDDDFAPALAELVVLVVATAPGPMGAPW